MVTLSVGESDTARMISVVVPIYNSEPTLQVLCERLLTCAKTWGEPFEIILVNDGSRDGSWQKLQQLQQASTDIRAIDLMRNYGQHNAVLCGIRESRGRTIVTIDDDLQHPPEEIAGVLRHLTSDVDVVYASPQIPEHGWWRGVASRLAKWLLQQAMGVRLAVTASAFRVFRAQLREAFEVVEGPFVDIDVLLSWGTERFSTVKVRHDPRAHGQSNYPFSALARHAINMLTGFSAVPLQMATSLGLLASGFGVLVLLWVVGRYLIVGGSVPGFPFLASSIAIFSGAQLVALGVIGEYIARIHFRSMRKPAYGIRQRIGTGGSGAS